MNPEYDWRVTAKKAASQVGYVALAAVAGAVGLWLDNPANTEGLVREAGAWSVVLTLAVPAIAKALMNFARHAATPSPEEENR